MLKSLKKRLALILIAAFAIVAVAFTAGTLGAKKTVTVKADNPALAVEESAWVRLTQEPYGLRFTLRVSNDLYAEVVTNDTDNVKRIGAIIIPYSYVEDYNAYVDENGAIGYHAYLEAEKDGKMIDLSTSRETEWLEKDAEADDYYAYVAVTDILYENTNRDFVAIAYVSETVDNEGTPEKVYSNYTTPTALNKRSISTVAKAAIADGEESAYLTDICATAAYQTLGVTKLENGYSFAGETYASLDEIAFAGESLGTIAYDDTLNLDLSAAIDGYYADYSGNLDLYQGSTKLATFAVTDGNVAIDIPTTAQAKNTSFTLDICGVKFTSEAFGITMKIDNATEMLAFSAGTNSTYKNGYYELSTNIDLGNNPVRAEWTASLYNAPANGFSGEFDGKGYVVYNGLYDFFGGLFGVISTSGVVKNMGIVNAELSAGTDICAYGSGQPVSVFADATAGTVSDVYVSAKITGTHPVITSGSNSRHVTYNIFCQVVNGGSLSNIVVECDSFLSKTTTAGIGQNYFDYVKGRSTVFSWHRKANGATTLNNVYTIVSGANVTGANSSDLAGSITSYTITQENKDFSALTSDIWADSTDVKVMAQEKNVLGRYTTAIYKETSSDTFGFDVDAHIYRAAPNTQVSLERTAITHFKTAAITNSEYFPADVTSGTLTDGEGVNLKLYYAAATSAHNIRNDANNPFDLSVASGMQASFKAVSDSTIAAGKSNVYKLQTYTDHQNTAGSPATQMVSYFGGAGIATAKAYLQGKKYIMDVYTTASVATINISWTQISFNAMNTINEDYVEAYDANGNKVSKLTPNAWYTLVYNGDTIFITDAYSYIGFAANSVTYFANMRIVSAYSGTSLEVDMDYLTTKNLSVNLADVGLTGLDEDALVSLKGIGGTLSNNQLNFALDIAYADHGEATLAAIADNAYYEVPVLICTKIITTGADLTAFMDVSDREFEDGDTAKSVAYCGYYVLGNDIDATGIVGENNMTTVSSTNHQRQSLGNFGFRGTFDGRGYSITGLTIDKNSGSTDYDGNGLFGSVARYSVIKNVEFKGCNFVISSGSGLGFLAFVIHGDIENVVVDVTSTGAGVWTGCVARRWGGTANVKNMVVNYNYNGSGNSANMGVMGYEATVPATIENLIVKTNIANLFGANASLNSKAATFTTLNATDVDYSALPSGTDDIWVLPTAGTADLPTLKNGYTA